MILVLRICVLCFLVCINQILVQNSKRKFRLVGEQFSLSAGVRPAARGDNNPLLTAGDRVTVMMSANWRLSSPSRTAGE
jgi:hypothetical protein